MRADARVTAEQVADHRLAVQFLIEVEAVVNRALSVDVHRRQPNMGAFTQLMLAAIDRAAREAVGHGVHDLAGGG